MISDSDFPGTIETTVSSIRKQLPSGPEAETVTIITGFREDHHFPEARGQALIPELSALLTAQVSMRQGSWPAL